MLNYIWFGLMAIALVVAAVNGTADAVTKAAVDSASSAVQISIGLIGIMTLWLGIMRVAEAAGLVTLVGRALSPLLRWLFPEVPREHPAGGALVVALAANMAASAPIWAVMRNCRRVFMSATSSSRSSRHRRIWQRRPVAPSMSPRDR